jgi:molecular chaperone DnaJ
MNLQEAYRTLELNDGASEDEAKKKFKELSFKYHPDRNKDADAIDKFKKINEAYSYIKEGKHRQEHIRSPFDGRHVYRQVENIDLYTTILFIDSVFGCKKEIKFKRHTKCHNCSGEGVIQLNNGCTTCGGKGNIITRQSNMIFSRTCDKCWGRREVKDCNICSGIGTLESEASASVNIPGGVESGVVLRLTGLGNYSGNFMGMVDQHTDVYLHLNVIQEPGLSLDGKDVVSEVDISLLEALQGCKKEVKTVSGNKEIEIKPLSKNKEEIIIPHLGVERVGNHRVSLNVAYPKDITKIVELLTES